MKKYIYLILSLFLLLFVYYKVKERVEVRKEPFFVFQDGKEILVMEENQIVNLKRTPFSLRFYCQRSTEEEKYNARIVTFLNKNEWESLKEDVPYKDFPYLRSETAMSAEELHNEFIFHQKTSGHHYAFYQSDKYRERNLKLLKENNSELYLEFKINKFYFYDQQKELKIADSMIKEIYVAIFINKNLDEIIDEGELKKMILKF